MDVVLGVIFLWIRAIFVPAPLHWAIMFSEEYGESRLEGGNPPKTIGGGGATAIGIAAIGAIAAGGIGGGAGGGGGGALPLLLILKLS